MSSLRSTRRRRAGAAAAAVALLPAGAAVVATLVAACPAAYAQGRTPRAVPGPRYRNLVNSRFATVSSGPQSAVIVDTPKGATAAEVEAAVRQRIRSDMAARSRGMAPLIARLRRAGALGKNTPYPVSGIVQTRQDGRLVFASQKVGISRAVGGGDITLSFSGWGDRDRQVLQGFFNAVYPTLREVYGAPAVSGTVEVVNIGAANDRTSDVNALRGGYYSPSENRIYLPIYPDSGAESFLAAFLLDLIHAFHGPAYFQYDAWEEGFARAAAAVCLRRPEVRSAIGRALNLPDDQLAVYQPTIPYQLTLLPFYDLFNQPSLGSPTFFPAAQANVDLDDEGSATGGFSLGKMILPRMGMSGAAWLKVYIEDQNFFRRFNEAYYAQFDVNANPSLAGNVPALRQIAASLLPNGVEGIGFQQWYERQYVLDTSVSVGRKLFAAVLPDNVVGNNDDDLSHAVVITHFNTVVRNGGVDEDLIAGKRVYGTYFDASNARVYQGQPGAEEAVLAEGEAFFTVTTLQRQGQDATRVTADFHVDDVATRTYFPAGYTGDFNGVILGPQAGGSVAVEQTTIFGRQTKTASGNVEGSSFGVRLGTPVTDLAQTVVRVRNNGAEQVFRFNTGDGLYYPVIRPDATGGAVVTLSKAFAAGQVPRLVSFPVQPLQKPVDQALGLPYSDFLLTFYDPIKNAYGTAVTDPAASIPAIAPGRGFWLKVQPADRRAEATVSMTGVAPATDTDFTVSAGYGWNLIGSPFAERVDLSQVLVKYLQQEPVTWEEAVEKNLVGATPFAFTGSNNPSGTEGYGTYTPAETLEQWQGYWLRVYVPGGVTLLLPGPDSPTSRAVGRKGRSVSATTPKPDWSVRLRARFEPQEPSAVARRTAEAVFGAARSATRGYDGRYDREAPPPIGPAVEITFPHTDDFGSAAGSRYVADFREPNVRGTYAVQVTAPSAGRVTLSWENLGSLPRTSRATLVDKETGERFAMRSRSSVTFAVPAGRPSRSFEAQVERALSTPLMIQNLTLNRVPGGRSTGGGAALSVGYTVSADADVTVELSTLAGRVIRRLAAGRAQAAGQRSVVWDGRGDNGAVLPAGAYLLRVTARGEDGSQVSQMRPFTLLR